VLPTLVSHKQHITNKQALLLYRNNNKREKRRGSNKGKQESREKARLKAKGCWLYRRLFLFRQQQL